MNWTPTPANTPVYLVQRLNAPMGGQRPFDYDYMGSAEFEWGAIPHTFKLLGDLLPQLTITKYQCGEHACWIVATKEAKEHAYALFCDQLTESKWRLKERTAIKGAYDPNDKWGRGYVGWMGVVEKHNRDHHPWHLFAIFKTEQGAKGFLGWVATVKAEREAKEQK